MFGRCLIVTGAHSPQAIETSSLGNWIPLKSRLAPIPFKGGRLFAEEILQQADSLDKEQKQLKRAHSFGEPFRGIFRVQEDEIHTKDVKTERFALLSLAHDTNEASDWSARSQYNGLIPFCSPVVELSLWLGTPKLPRVACSGSRQVQINSQHLHLHIHLHTAANATCGQ